MTPGDIKTVLVIDDEEKATWAFEQFLEGQGYRALIAHTAEDGLEKVRDERPDVIICDIKLPGLSGLDALPRIREMHPDAYVIVMTAYGTAQTAIEAIQRGAYDYLTKPLDLTRLRALLERIEQAHALRTEFSAPAADDLTDDADASPAQLVGESPAMQEIYKLIGMLTMNRVTVLIDGESGTGKEGVARMIHHSSPERGRPFVVVNCGALAETLLESELFGHEKGAFTSAERQSIGKIEAAEDGTLFLDEIASTSPALQVRLLRALQEREFQRVGGTQTLPVRARVIAATNIPLEDVLADGSFREDLYYRLKVVSLKVPPLRERRTDIPLLIDHFLRRISDELGRAVHGVEPKAMETLLKCPWHGNVRELENAIRRAAVFARDGVILSDHLPPDILDPHVRPPAAGGSPTALLERALSALSGPAEDGNVYYELQAHMDRATMGIALARSGDNQVKAAQWLGISRTTLRRRIEELNISDSEDDR
ncbi:sigma-54-dependent Fis family transcriptional regulator [Candidatus Poribacteria bacterium]|jgi:DNA-binding NtrC family response regulator|nr:sigma-54-dependent Fis family transcriptional regulator [Candidatus Poribacteria bacterium]MBT5710317.1 sigma-54-dependent Fis family transcriptional regulator [Candidatus Poribacteria bacterium]MBT7808376.1 sigma-54-dependent Fis family transcriptional regulator [Candidatus Poribacteria bacterium]